MEGIKISFTREVACGGDGSQSMDKPEHANVEERVFHIQRVSCMNKQEMDTLNLYWHLGISCKESESWNPMVVRRLYRMRKEQRSFIENTYF